MSITCGLESKVERLKALSKTKYESLISGTVPIESHLHKHLIEHLNSEIVSQTISNMDLVIHWIRSSYLYIRAIQKPFHYGFPRDAAIETVEQKLEELCVNAIDELEKYGLVTKTNSSVKATQLGRLMAHYYLNFEAMKHFTKTAGTESVQEMFNNLITCPDFSDGFHLRVNDKRFLNSLNKATPDTDCIRYPIQGKVKTVTDKVSCLMQATLGNIPITDSSITEEASQMVKLGQRIGRALQEFVALLDDKNNFSAFVSIMLLLKSLHANLWENSPYVCKQLKKIGHVYSKVLSSNGKTTFDSIINSSPSDIEMVLKKRPPFGKEFHDAVLILPQFTVTMKLQENQICVVVKQVNPKFVCDQFSRGVTLILGDSMNTTLFINHSVQYFLVKYGTFERKVSLKNPSASTVTAHLIHNGIVGLDKSETFNLREDEQPEPEPEPVRVTPSKRKSVDNSVPVRVTPSKRKSLDKSVRGGKQPKISEYLTKKPSPKEAPKRRNKTKAKNLSSQAECDRQMEMMEHDGIIDWAEELNSPELLDDNGNSFARGSEHQQAAEDNQSESETNDKIDFVQKFKMPSKPIFKFVKPSRTLPGSASLQDNNTSFEHTVSESMESEEVLKPINKKRQPSVLPNKQLLSTKQLPSVINTQNKSTVLPNKQPVSTKQLPAAINPPNKPSALQNKQPLSTKQLPSAINPPNNTSTRTKDIRASNKAQSDESNRSTNAQKETRGDENRIETKTTETELKNDNNKSQNVYVPSCIKAMFGSQTVSQRVRSQCEKEVHRKKDINLRYDHLLTPLDESDLYSNSQSQSLCDVIEGQHKLHRAPMNINSSVFAFQNFYTDNFSAVKELERIDHISRTNCEDNEEQLFSLEYASFPAKRSSHQLLAEPPIQIKEQRKKIVQKEKPIGITTPMALNEHKYSKWNNGYQKLQSPQPSATDQPPNKMLKPSDGFPSSEKSVKSSAQPFYNYFREPMSPAGKVDRSTSIYRNPLINFNNRNTSFDWFEASRRSQQAPSASISQIDYDPLTLREEFVPSQSGWV